MTNFEIIAQAIGAIICEVFSLCSIVIGLIRYDIKPKPISKK